MAKVNRDEGNVLYLDGGSSCMGIYICQNPSSKHLKWAYFIAYLFLFYFILLHIKISVGFLGGLDGKESACSSGDLGFIPGSGRSPGEGTGYPLQYSCLANSMDRGARQATVYGLQRIRHD